MSVSTSNFITSGLVCHLDAFKHSGTGTTWSDLNRTYNGTLVGTPPYTHPTKNALNSLNGGTGATYNYSVSPDGAKNGIRVWNTPSVNSYFTFNNGTPNTVTGQVYTISFYGKADTANSLLFVESFYNDRFNVNLNTATISNLGPNVNSSSVTNAGNGWYRYSVTFTPTSAHVMTRVMYVGAYGNTATQHYAQVYGFQVQYGSAVPFAPSFMFDNSTQYVTSTIPDSFWQNSWTVSVWVNFNKLQAVKGLDNAIIGHGNAVVSSGLHLGERGGYAYFGFYSDDVAASVTPLVANTWYNLVFSHDLEWSPGDSLREIYVNGIFNGNRLNVPYVGTGSNTQIGQYSWNTTHKMFGQIASVSFYNRALTATEIALNYKNTKGRYLQ